MQEEAVTSDWTEREREREMTVLVNVRFLRASSRMSSCGMECAGPPLTLPPIKPQIGAISTHDSTLLRSQAGSRPSVMAFSDEHGPPLADIDSGDCPNVQLHSDAWPSITISIRNMGPRGPLAISLCKHTPCTRACIFKLWMLQ